MSEAPWEIWQRTRRTVFTATRDAWNRRTSVDIGTMECEVCGQTTEVMSIDSSDGEYHSFDCCRPCMEKLWSKT